jgi:hypothetical protein
MDLRLLSSRWPVRRAVSRRVIVCLVRANVALLIASRFQASYVETC